MHEPDAECTGRRAHGMPVVAIRVRMGVEVEVPVAPAHEQADGEEHDEHRDRGLGALLHALGQVALGEQDRDAEHDERDPVPHAPPRAEPAAERATRSRPDATSVVIAAR